MPSESPTKIPESDREIQLVPSLLTELFSKVMVLCSLSLSLSLSPSLLSMLLLLCGFRVQRPLRFYRSVFLVSKEFSDLDFKCEKKKL